MDVLVLADQQELCADAGFSLEDLPVGMEVRERKRGESVGNPRCQPELITIISNT